MASIFSWKWEYFSNKNVTKTRQTREKLTYIDKICTKISQLSFTCSYFSSNITFLCVGVFHFDYLCLGIVFILWNFGHYSRKDVSVNANDVGHRRPHKNFQQVQFLIINNKGYIQIYPCSEKKNNLYQRKVNLKAILVWNYFWRLSSARIIEKSN